MRVLGSTQPSDDPRRGWWGRNVTFDDKGEVAEVILERVGGLFG
jgi:hypothetical protein